MVAGSKVMDFLLGIFLGKKYCVCHYVVLSDGLMSTWKDGIEVLSN